MQSRCCIFCIVSCPVTIFQNWSQPNCLHFFILLFILASAVSNLIICLLSYSIKYRHQRGGITFLIGQSPANTVPDCNSFLFTHICICLSVFVYLFLYLYMCVFGYICIDVSVFVHVFLSMYWCFWIWMSRFLTSCTVGQISGKCQGNASSAQSKIFCHLLILKPCETPPRIFYELNTLSGSRTIFGSGCSESFWLYFSLLKEENENVYFSTPLAVGCIGPVTGVITVTAPLHWAQDSPQTHSQRKYF